MFFSCIHFSKVQKSSGGLNAYTNLFLSYSLFIITNYPELRFIEFACINNQLTSLDVSNHTGCTALVELNCGNNQLTSLNASTNTALTRLHCYTNQLASLDVSGCTALVYLDCGINRLTGLDVSANTAIKQLYCEENQFSATALNSVFTALPSRVPSDYAKIYIAENPGIFCIKYNSYFSKK
ncbi:MAG: hypothetical protein LBK94_05920 [Prevotellaceae bacterium]|jgi:Leucine-rich repeat (LRR) protein|nr:hypothetical protein [Prevotellaceae bacterium]